MDGFIVRFTRRDNRAAEEYYYAALSDAEYHLSLFREDDSGLYLRIDLLSYPNERALDSIVF